MFRWLTELPTQLNNGNSLVGTGVLRLVDGDMLSLSITAQDQRDAGFNAGALRMGYALIAHIARFTLKGILPQSTDADSPNTPPTHGIRLAVGTFGTFGAQRLQQLHVTSLNNDRGQPRVRERNA